MRASPARISRCGGAAGFSLIEVVIVLVVTAIIAALGVPSLARIMEDNRIRAMTEEFREGLALARGQAIQRNRTIRFDVSGNGWSVVLPGTTSATDTVLHAKTALNAESRFAVAASTASLSFSSAGRPSVANYQIDVGRTGAVCAASSGGTARCLRILVTPGGSIRSCDPAVATGDPRSCT